MPGKPVHKNYTDLERRNIHIPPGLITVGMLDSILAGKYTLPAGQYGLSEYGRARYGVRLGVYGFDVYGQAYYA